MRASPLILGIDSSRRMATCRISRANPAQLIGEVGFRRDRTHASWMLERRRAHVAQSFFISCHDG